MENVMSVPSAACLKFQSWGKFLALNHCCFVINALSVAIQGLTRVRSCFTLDICWCKRGKMEAMLYKGAIVVLMLFFFVAILLLVWFWRNSRAFGYSFEMNKSACLPKFTFSLSGLGGGGVIDNE